MSTPSVTSTPVATPEAGAQAIAAQQAAKSVVVDTLAGAAKKPEATPEAAQQAEKPDANAPTEAKSKEETDFSARFAALAREQKKLQEEKKRVEELAKKYGQLDPILSAPKEKIGDILDYLGKSGVTLDDIIQFELKRDKPVTAEERAQTVEQKLEAFIKAQEEEKKKADQDRINRAVEAFRASISETIDGAGEQFELLQAYRRMGTDTVDMVYQVCEKFFEETGTELPVEKACEQIEEQLLEHSKQLASANKLKALIAQTSGATNHAKPEGAAGEVPEKGADLESRPLLTATDVLQAQAKAKLAPPQMTLTNKQGPTATVSKPESQGLLSDEESKARAAELLRQLKAKGKVTA